VSRVLLACRVVVGVLVVLTFLPQAARSQGFTSNPVTVVPLLPPTPQPEMVSAYAGKYGVTDAESTRRLALQHQTGNIVARMREALGASYAGVWFDNSAGRIVVAVAPPGGGVSTPAIAAARQVARDLQADASVDVVVADFSWDALTAAQSLIDEGLSDLERAGIVNTGIDSEKDALSIGLSETASAAQSARVQKTAASAGVRTDVHVEPASVVSPKLASCTFPNCDHPLRGGVSIYNDYATCSAAYLAIGNTTEDEYMLTAGHCHTASATWSAETASGASHTIGSMDRSVWSINGDYARIDAEGSWWQMAGWTPESIFWNINNDYPTYGAGWAPQGYYGCRSGGAESTAQCGTVQLTGQTITYGGVTVAGEFSVDTCANPGDSGGPFMMDYYAVGITSATTNYCSAGGASTTYFAEVMNAVVPANMDVFLPVVS
jgi:streptogrisin C